MGRKFYLQLVVLVLIGFSAVAQTGEIRGRVTEKGGKEGVSFAAVAAIVNGTQIQAAQADFDGNYVIKPLPPGKYDVKATNVGYQSAIVTGVLVTVDKASFVNFELAKGVELKVIDVQGYRVPLIDKGSPATQKTIEYADIQAAPTRDINTVASTTAGVYQKDEGGSLNIRGARSDATVYFVDGIKVRGNPTLPQKGTEQITVITGGVPAQYGDVAGGVIAITTRGPSSTFGGGVEFLTSQFLDPYGFNLGSFDITGPIYRKKDAEGKPTGQAVAGYFLAGEYQYDKDPTPPAIQIYKVKDDILEFARKNPLVPSPNGQGFIHRSSFYTLDSFEVQKYRENVAAKSWRLNGKIDVRPFKDVTLTLGGTFFRNDRHDFIDIYSLMNSDNNPQTIETNWRAFAKITHRLGGEQAKDKESASVIQNAFYTLQADYSVNNSISQQDLHKDRIFDYGYLGKFQSYSAPFYFPTTDSTIELLGYFDTLYQFTADPRNENTANYTSQYYAQTAPFGSAGYTDNVNNVQLNGGLVNGDNRVGLNMYGLWATPGRVRSFYGKDDQTQARLIGSFSADIKKHNIVLGFEYEQRVDRGYSVNPNSLWTLMRNLGNFNLSGVDPTSAVQLGGDTITYTRAQYIQSENAEGDKVRGFFENVRDKLGVAYTDTIQTDAIDPSFYSLSMFSPDELINSGLVNYYGYDYIGNKTTSNNWSLNDFYVNKDKNNNYLREIDAFRPVYFAGYIQDRFTFNDIIFNIGVRVDRFDANQRVLKDQYLLYDTKKAGDLDGAILPEGIGNDYYVYVNNAVDPNPTVVGYRNGNTWYNASGTPITDLTPLLQAAGNPGGIQPYLTETGKQNYSKNLVNPNVFKDYDPQVNVMPRVAFSFPISDEAYFAAHYDILTQRPQDAGLIRFNPLTYQQWAQNNSGVFSNPDLKPERTTNYEINFQQKLSRSSAFGISAFYSERRNNIQIINLDYAFPIRYQTYGNIDFGTVKGLTFNYDLRRTSNVRMSISYTLQFAEGTGSDPNANSGILSTQGQTNLREIKPLNFDQRHTFVTSFDYHYADGRDYNGPVWGNKQVFANAGLNLVFRAGSGTPYTRKANITPEADFTTTANGRSQISGQLNGSRYPWQFRIDARADKAFTLNNGTKANGDKKKAIAATIYVQVLNVLNTQNVVSVYRATGSPSDDGYLSTATAQTAISQKVSPQAYIDQYRVALNNPANYSLPRRIRLGIQLNF